MLDFNEERHEYRWDGVVVPSVTQVLAPLSDWSRIPPETLERARQRGIAVHRLIELEVANDLDESTVTGPLIGYLEQWRSFVKKTGFKAKACELRLYSKRYGYAGTLDLFGNFKGESGDQLIDTKSGGIPVVAGPQLAAYENLLVENRYTVRAVRRCLDLKETSWKLSPLYMSRDDLRVFLSALTLYNFRKEHGLG